MRRRTPTLWAAAALVGAVVLVVLLTRGHGHRPAPRPQPAPGLLLPRYAPGAPALPPPAQPELGANVNRLFNDGTFSPRQIRDAVRALAATGANAARSDALWEAAEPAGPVHGVHHYDWRFADNIAGSLAKVGLRWLPVVDYSPLWIRSLPAEDHSPPATPAPYAAYVRALVARYGTGGRFWALHPRLPRLPMAAVEIWNEPDGGHFWLPRSDPPAYGNLYAAARSAAQSADPRIRVVVGGLTDPPGFMAELLQARPDLRGHIDGVAVHPYGPWPRAVLQAVVRDRAALRRLGLGTVPLYVTEFGWTPRPSGALDYLPARLRPQYTRATVAALGHTDCGIAGVFLYTWVTPERDPRVGDDWFGLHPPRGGSSPAERAFAAGMREARRPGPQLPVCATGAG